MGRALLLFGVFAVSDAGHWRSPPRSMSEVRRFCNEHPKAFGHYFPPDQLKMPLPRRDAGEDESVDRVASDRCAAGAILASYNEPMLTKPLVDEAYRVIWIPSFAPPLVIRISRNSGGGYTATLKRDVAEWDTITGHFTEVVRGVSSSDFESIRAARPRGLLV